MNNDTLLKDIFSQPGGGDKNNLIIKKGRRERRPYNLIDAIRKIDRLDQYYIPTLTNASYANELGQIRALGEMGLKTVAMDHNRRSICFHSRYSVPVLAPDYLNDFGNYMKFLLDLGSAVRETGRIPLLSVVDAETLLDLFKNYDEEIKNVYKLGADLDLQRDISDKYKQYLIAEDLGIPTPETWILNDYLFANRPGIRFPAMVKPRKGREFYRQFKKQAVEVKSWSEIADLYASSRRIAPLLLQERVRGPEERNFYNCGVYCAKQRKPAAVFTGRRIRSTRANGSTALAQSYDMPEIRSHSLEFLDHIHYHGPCEMEYKTDQRDGKIKFLELNPRLWKWHSLATHCGVNLTYHHYLDAAGLELPLEMPRQLYGPKWWLMWMDLWNSMSRIKNGEFRLSEYLDTLTLNFVNGIDEFNDPLPGIINFFSLKWIT